MNKIYFWKSQSVFLFVLSFILVIDCSLTDDDYADPPPAPSLIVSKVGATKEDKSKSVEFHNVPTSGLTTTAAPSISGRSNDAKPAESSNGTQSDTLHQSGGSMSGVSGEKQQSNSESGQTTAESKHTKDKATTIPSNTTPSTTLNEPLPASKSGIQRGRSMSGVVGPTQSNNNEAIPGVQAATESQHNADNATTSTSNAPSSKTLTAASQNNSSKELVHYPPDQPQTIEGLSGFETCAVPECNKICRSSDKKLSRCDSKSDKLCLCTGKKFVSVDVEGNVSIANLSNAQESACNTACMTRESYARIRTKPDGTKTCICLINQKTSTGVTSCDEKADPDVCKELCQTETATCAFNGACLCHSNWHVFYNMTVDNVREEYPEENEECLKRCMTFHHDYAARVYDTTLSSERQMTTHPFQSKYCLCGPEELTNTYKLTQDIIAQGFQVCTGLKCKQRCGMKEAICEPKLRRACLCRRQNIFIGNHLWMRMPSKSEEFCSKACERNGLHGRVIELNPLLDPYAERFQPWYRKSTFQYQYDGKFCHCIKLELDLTDFRPCTHDLCKWACGHQEAVCDESTRRNCICNTHNLLGGLGRKPDSGEVNCGVTCRHNLLDARVLDLTFDTNSTGGKVPTKSKYCACIKPVTYAGLTHCEGGDRDMCPQFCSNPSAYCTREKFCECGIMRNLLNNGTVRLPTGKEAEECGEKCISWMWPIAEDTNNRAFIYDEGRRKCYKNGNCPPVDTTIWSASTRGEIAHTVDAVEDFDSSVPKRYCLCSKSRAVNFAPGTRFLPMLLPQKAPKGLNCVGEHTCQVLGTGVLVKS